MAFETERLRARPLSERDASLYCDLYSDAWTMRYIGPPLARETARRSFRRALALQRKRPIEWLFVVYEERTEGSAVGFSSIPRFGRRAKRLEVGIMLRESARGQGYAREALAGLARHLFAIMPVDQLYMACSPDNAAMRKLAAALGFTAEEKFDSKVEACIGWTLDRFAGRPPGSAAAASSPPTRKRSSMAKPVEDRPHGAARQGTR